MGAKINKENLIRKEVEYKLQNNFADFWIKILTHNVFRYQAISKEVGALEGLIVQVIAWHHYLSSISDLSIDNDKPVIFLSITSFLSTKNLFTSYV